MNCSAETFNSGRGELFNSLKKLHTIQKASLRMHLGNRRDWASEHGTEVTNTARVAYHDLGDRQTPPRTRLWGPSSNVLEDCKIHAEMEIVLSKDLSKSRGMIKWHEEEVYIHRLSLLPRYLSLSSHLWTSAGMGTAYGQLSTSKRR